MPDTTCDGLTITPDPPFGASVIVYRRSEGSIEFLLLHRAHQGSDYEGDWALTPPAGARWPGEDPDEGARRELKEETGLTLPLRRGGQDTTDWLIYIAEAPFIAIIGGFLFYAALTVSPDRAGGIAQALSYVRGLPFGSWLYGAAAFGLVAFGVYSLIEARYRSIDAPTLADVRP